MCTARSVFSLLLTLIGIGVLAFAAALSQPAPAGAAAQPQRTCLLTWSQVVPAVDGVLTGIAANSENDVWAVGFHTDAAYHAHSLSMHWDGNTWAVIPNANFVNRENAFRAVAALGSDNVWAVGYRTQRRHSMIQRWTGNNWKRVRSPDIGALYAITGTGADNLWVAGVGGILHWNGTQWRSEDLPALLDRASFARVQLVGDDVWALGNFVKNTNAGYRHHMLVARRHGGKWAIVAQQVYPPYTCAFCSYDFPDMLVLSPDDLWVVGGWSYRFVQLAMYLHWNGAAFDSFEYGFPDASVSGISGSAADDLWSVSPIFLHHWDGSSWDGAIRHNAGLNQVLALSPDLVWGVGSSIMRGEPPCLELTPTPTPTLTPTPTSTLALPEPATPTAP